MSLDDFKLVKQGGLSSVPTYKYRVQAGATNIKRGEPVKLSSISGEYVVPLADNEPVTGTPTFLGIAATTSTETASADGFVEVYKPLPGLVFRAKATTPGNIDTDSELKALLNHHVAIDLISGVYTVDENATHAGTNGVIIIDGDIVNGTLDVEFKAACTPGALAA